MIYKKAGISCDEKIPDFWYVEMAKVREEWCSKKPLASEEKCLRAIRLSFIV